MACNKPPLIYSVMYFFKHSTGELSNVFCARDPLRNEDTKTKGKKRTTYVVPTLAPVACDNDAHPSVSPGTVPSSSPTQINTASRFVEEPSPRIPSDNRPHLKLVPKDPRGPTPPSPSCRNPFRARAKRCETGSNDRSIDPPSGPPFLPPSHCLTTLHIFNPVLISSHFI